jgi:dipeptidyl aminopeptidase/acylaminoacyl peptidase
MRPEHLDHLRSASAPSLTPDGALAVAAVSRPDTATDRYLSALWVVPTDGSPARRLTRGPADSAPEVSPDGRWVAFLRAPDKGAPQLAVVGLGGGEPVVLTDRTPGAGAPVWSPDGSRIAFSARVPEEGRYGTEEEVGPEAEPPRLIASNSYRVDGLGYTRDRRLHLFVLDVADVLDAVDDPARDLPALPLTPHQVTDGDHDDSAPAWSPDGRWLAFVSDRHPTREDDLRSGVHRVSADGGEVHVVTRGDVSVDQVEWVDPTTLLLVASDVGPDGTDFVGAQSGLWRVSLPSDLVGPVEPVRLTDAERYDLGEPGSRVAVTDAHVLLSARNRGGVDLLRLALDAEPGTEPEVLVTGRRQVRGVAATPDGATVVAVVSDPDRSGDLAVVDSAGPRLLTDLSAGLPDPVAGLHERVATAPDGYEVHGWVLLPDEERWGPGPYPVLLNIHGGPFAQYGWGLFDEAQVYAGAGYAVVMCNPRGSAGYGRTHGTAVRHAFGTVDADDVLAFLDHVLGNESLRLDPERVGVMGGSYGGYMTALLTTRTDRFVAAVVERGYLDPETFSGASDIGWFFPWQYHGTVENMREQAPMTHVANVTTPTLVIHSEADWRCPVDQGQRWYAALRRQGVEAELLLFPGEGHELTRSGRPKHRLARFEHLLRWWAKHLPVTPVTGD